MKKNVFGERRIELEIDEEEEAEEVEESREETAVKLEKEGVEEVRVGLEAPVKEVAGEKEEKEPKKVKTTMLEEARFITEHKPKFSPVRFVKMKFESQDDIEQELKRLSTEFKKDSEE